ncbi:MULTISPECIES: virion core protein, T7 gp14 family [Sphingomonas]|uniref:Internal virion protein B n=1 Tax=Sphingomonas molluscorum TaxID=418184 RepID=A0ABU8Q767_9SPHN|nr:hypothetical protein [Sphingomonas sp. JUb134]MBM7406923.1 hypothetical protein [Sphingomonas sp. JUb134]
MCEPVTLAAIGAGMAALSTATATVTAVQQNKYQAKVATRNADLESAAGRDAVERGKIESQNYQRQASQMQGAQRAALAANGIDINFGSAAGVRADTAMMQAEDAQTIRENSMREVRGIEINAANYRAQVQASRQAATGAAIKGVFDFGSTVLGGASQYRTAKLRRAG